MRNGVSSAILLAISLAFCPTTNGQYFLGCPPVDDVNDAATILPNPFNCSTFYICAQGTPLLFVCPGHLQYNYELQVCDYPERANCFELQQYPEQVTTYLPVAAPEASHVHVEENPKPEDNAAPQPTQVPEEITPESQTEQPKAAVEFQLHSTHVPSEWLDTLIQARSNDKGVKAVTGPAESFGTPQPQPFQEEDQKRDDHGSALASMDETPTASALQPQPTENPTEQEPQENVASSVPTDGQNLLIVSAPDSQQKPSRQKTELKRDPEASEDATQLYQELEPTSEANAIVTALKPQSEETPAVIKENAHIVIDQVETGGEQERPLSHTSPPQTPEPLPTDEQVGPEPALPSDDIQSQLTDAQRVELNHTNQQEEHELQSSNQKSEAVDDTTQAELQQTVWKAPESSATEPEPTAATVKFESEDMEELAESSRQPSEIVEEQQSSRDITKLDSVNDAASGVELETSEKPLEGPYELTEKPHEPEQTEEEPKIEPQAKQVALELEPAATEHAITLAPDQSETQAQLELTQQSELSLNEATPKITDDASNTEESVTELGQPEPQPTPKSAEIQAQTTEQAKEPKSALEMEPLESESTEMAVEQVVLANDLSSESGSEPRVQLDDTLETIDPPRTALTENSVHTKPLSTASNDEADKEGMEEIAVRSAVTEADAAPFKNKVYITTIKPESERDQQDDSSAIGSSTLGENTALQPSDAVAAGSETLATTNAAERVPGVSESTPKSSARLLIDDSVSNMDNPKGETEQPPQIDDVDAAYEEKIRSDAVEIDYYS